MLGDSTKTDYDTIAEEVQKYDKLLKIATLGYFKAKIWGDEQLAAKWGEINDRALTKVSIKLSNTFTY
jgi:hypothetical protein